MWPSPSPKVGVGLYPYVLLHQSAYRPCRATLHSFRLLWGHYSKAKQKHNTAKTSIAVRYILH